MYGPLIPHGFGLLAGVLGAITWAIGTLILVAILVALVVLLARFLWFGTKAAQRYLELNGSPARRVRVSAPATESSTAPAAQRGAGASAPATTAAPRTAPAATTTKPVAKPKTPKPPTA